MNSVQTVTSLLRSGREHEMIPSDGQMPPSKRKASDDANPLTKAAKRSKNQAKPENKRKLNGETVAGGLRITRAPPSRPHSPHSSHTPQPEPTRAPSRPPSSQSNRPLPSLAAPGPSEPPTKKLRAESSGPKSRVVGKGKDRAVSASARDDQEVDEDVRQMQSETDTLRRKSRAAEASATNSSGSSSINPAFQFPSAPAKAKHADALELLPEHDTPQMARNKVLRSENTAQHTHARRSSISGRGKRISSTYETTGVISQPHTSVSDSSFYKHIDCDLPEGIRARQLLIWCTSRAPLNPTVGSSSKQKTGSKSSGKDPPLPPLHKDSAEVLQKVKDGMMKLLAEKRIDTNTYSPYQSSNVLDGLKDTTSVGENVQNVRNKAREIKFEVQLGRIKAEEVAWDEAEDFYKSYRKNTLADMERLRHPPSAKAKGKQRATSQDPAEFMPREYELPEEFRGNDGIRLAMSVIDDEQGQKNTLGQRMEDLQFKVDHLQSFIHTAIQATSVAEADLDQRFAQLSLTLTSRSHLHSSSAPDPTSLSSYLAPTHPTTDPQDLLRALSRVDAARPPVQMGNAARRAAREVQRANEQGGGERRLTGVPPPTPRKAPGTPRRGATPGKDR
ncbi:hypothetical protein PLICRDRAFT_146108 [Plicaturopsis crispa FD-325 SS-3]|uniref:Unplaced genomic scaffold PLICRscaffold_15, whole genome shotgun sequence n=1 Tax=Plicaturopsis crispa FD-325 SS-3 TaxID=944288 RepID=A0A0C9T7H2_PLICR|nr:hypothetical protein PLICRDRAFT_146108 [Plicaturopsis crispa FD-325 SS-3]